MRINVYAPQVFFRASGPYNRLEPLLAVAACITHSAGSSKPFDVQINQVLTDGSMGQYLFTPSSAPDERFTQLPRTHVSLEVDHLVKVGQEEEDLLCAAHVALVLSQLDRQKDQRANCWSKGYGAPAGVSGWCEEQFELNVTNQVHYIVREFREGNCTTEWAARQLRDWLLK
ncbi:MAG: hypothetical protein WDZ93_01120 [Candidatus Paceibacterota bacterium]